MREIKFKGRKPNGEWVYGDLVTIETTDGIPIKKEILPFDAVLFDNTEEVEEDTIGQFTGLHDKNGKEIYEGDIVRYDMGGKCEVSYCVSGGYAGFDLSPAFHDEEHHLTDVEVIGNIHDNPELLNE